MTDDERIALSAAWAEKAYGWLAHELNAGGVVGAAEEERDQLDTLCDGLRVLADNLRVLSDPFPPPSMAQLQPLLRIVE